MENLRLSGKVNVDMSTVSVYNYFYIISIALLYPYFFSKLCDVAMDAKTVYNYCKGIPYSLDMKKKDRWGYKLTEPNPDYEDCYKKKKVLEKEFDTKKYSIMVVIGIIGIILGTHFAKKNRDAGMGIALGGLFCVIYYTVYNWRNINELAKLVISGGSLASLIYASSKITFVL